MEEHPEALYIVQTLAKAGFVAYYAGGWVRDFLLGHPSEDIDIATNAPPETIQALFPHTVPIGISFGIVLVLINGHSFEVATFRRDFDYKDARRPSRIEFTTASEDAKRRDFTINGMFYDPLKGEVLDFIGGKEDLEAKIIRAIGDPHERIKEDRLRMIRAARLSCRFGFPVESKTLQAIRAHAKELFPAVAIERVVQELTKAHAQGKLRLLLTLLHEWELLPEIFPELEKVSLEEVIFRLEPIQRYPMNAPLIASLLSLFPHYCLEEVLTLCKKLKLSNLDVQFTVFLLKAKELIEIEEAKVRPVELVEWAYLYANSFSTPVLEILGCHFNEERRAAFYKEHEARMALLAPFISRIQKKDPIITSKDLMELGIVPGKTMGKLLQEADRISINEQLLEKGHILERVKELPFWPAS